MDALNQLLHNPAGLLAVLCLVGAAGVANVGLIALLRGRTLDFSRWRRALTAEAGIWRRSVTGGQTAQRRQAAQLDELHQLVGQLEAKPGDQDQPPPKP